MLSLVNNNLWPYQILVYCQVGSLCIQICLSLHPSVFVSSPSTFSCPQSPFLTPPPPPPPSPILFASHQQQLVLISHGVLSFSPNLCIISTINSLNPPQGLLMSDQVTWIATKFSNCSPSAQCVNVDLFYGAVCRTKFNSNFSSHAASTFTLNFLYHQKICFLKTTTPPTLCLLPSSLFLSLSLWPPSCASNYITKNPFTFPSHNSVSLSLSLNSQRNQSTVYILHYWQLVSWIFSVTS